jgi:hypothetical protein
VGYWGCKDRSETRDTGETRISLPCSWKLVNSGCGDRHGIQNREKSRTERSEERLCARLVPFAAPEFRINIELWRI